MITILKNSSKEFKLPLVDNLGYSYDPQINTIKAVNENPELGTITFDLDTLTGTIHSKDTNGELKYHFSATSTKGTPVSGSDVVTIADEVPPEDANQMVALYSSTDQFQPQ